MTAIPSSTHPAGFAEIVRRSNEIGFPMASGAPSGAFLAVLAATKPGGRFLEIGTGAGHATSWLLQGMDSASSLVSIDNDPRPQAIARDVLGNDPRVTFETCDGAEFLRQARTRSFDVVFADAWPGKYEELDRAMDLVKPGGLWIGDDMLPQANWPEGHQKNVDSLLERLHALPGWRVISLNWDTGFVLAARVAG
jgi:predicted O-methyltransferase YrrM